ncbi:uncharacterized protein LOC113773469 [Coffea eugenioides]|uniref:uncharacterized protein LOC113773469 n=1 Tax=Coffea eugenioides TaxID=49369 RepID=UPI000F6055DF|nr:uncharacterized protein LOC113773469 [Coffea eugenioides]
MSVVGSGATGGGGGAKRNTTTAAAATTSTTRSSGGIGGSGKETGAVEANVVGRGVIRLEEAVVPLGGWAGLHVLVEKGEDIDVQVGVGPHGRPLLPAHQLVDEVAVVLLGILRSGSGLVGVPLGGPAGLENTLLKNAACIRGGGIDDPGVGLEKDELQRDLLGVGLVGEVGVGIDEERGAGLEMEVEDGSQAGGEVRVEPAGEGEVGGLEDGEGVGSGDGDLVLEVEGAEDGVDALHSPE